MTEAKKAKKAKNAGGSKKRATWSIDPDSALEEMMNKAILATGKERSDLIRECVRDNLRRIVKQSAEEREQALRDFESDYGDAGKGPSKS